MPDVSLNGIEFVIKGSSDKASDSIDGLVSKLSELAEAISKAFNSAAFGGIGKKAKKETEPLDSALQDLIRNADKATQLKGKLDGLRDSLENAFKAGNEKRAWGIQGQILSTEAALDKFDTTPLTQEMQDLISNASQVDILENKLLSLREAMQAAFEAGNADKAFGFRAQIIQTEAALERARAAAEKTAPAIKEVGDAAKRSTSPLAGFVASIKRIAFYRMIRAVIKEIAEAIKEGAQSFYDFTKRVNPQFTNYAKALDGVKAASAQMKNQLGAAFGSLYAAIAPIITSLISLVTRLANALTMIFARMSGASGWYRATEGAASAIGAVGGAAKEALKYLAPFDELNRLPSNNGGGGGGGSGGNGGDYEWVPFKDFDLGDGIQSIVQWFTDAFKGAAEWLESVDWSELPGKIVTWISDEFKKINISGLASAIAEFVGAALGAVTGFTLGSINEIINWVDEYIYNGFHNADGSLKTGKEIVNWLLKSIAYGFVGGGAASSYDTVIKPFIEGFEKAFGSNTDAIDGVGSAFCSALFGSITSHLPDIGAWVREHIWGPIKDFFTTETPPDFGDGMTLPISTDLSGFQLPDLKAFKKAWDGIKNKTAKLTAKLAGTKESVFKTLASKWETIKTKSAELTANLKNNVKEGVLDKLRDGWNALKDKTATFTANLKNNTVVQKFIDAWNGLKDKALELKVGIQDKIKSAWNAAARAWNSSAILSKLGTLPYLAKGGILDAGQIFVARESGPELVGQFGNKTGVMNNQQIVDSVSRGVANAIAGLQFSVSSTTQTYNSTETNEETIYRAMLRALNSADREPIEIDLDGDPIYRSVVNRNRKETFRTGVNPLMSRA